MTRVSRPSDAPYTAAPKPAGPPPMMARSTSSCGPSSAPIPSARPTRPPPRARSSAPPPPEPATGPAQLGAAREPHERQLGRGHRRDQLGQLGIVLVLRVVPRVRQPPAPPVVDHRARGRRRPRPDDLDADALMPLERLAARDEGREEHVAEGAVVEQQRTQLLSLDGDVAHGLGDDRRQVDRLPRHQVELAEEPRRPVPDDLVPRGVTDGRLALEDRDEREALVADPEEDVADLGGALLAVLGERRELRRGQDRADAHPLRGYACAGVATQRTRWR